MYVGKRGVCQARIGQAAISEGGLHLASGLGAPPLHSTSRTRGAEKRLNPMEVVWNSYGIGMESVWCIRPSSPKRRASNTKITRWRNMSFAACKPMAYDLQS